MPNTKSSNSELATRLQYLRAKAGNTSIKLLAAQTNHSSASIHAVFTGKRVTWPIVQDLLTNFGIDDEDTMADYRRLWTKTLNVERRQPYHELSPKLDLVINMLEEIKGKL